MLKTQDQYDYVKNLLVTRMSGYRRNSFKLQRLYEIISTTVENQAYVDISYKEFYDMFVKECVNGNIPDHKFTIVEEGFLDKKKNYPYANIQVDFQYTPKRKRKAKINNSTSL